MSDEKETINMFQGFILGMVQQLNVDDVKYMVNNDIIPPILDYPMPTYLMGVQKIIAGKKEQIIKFINMDYVMRISQKYRPDLLPIFQTEQGYKWMQRFLKLVTFIVENAELNQYEIKMKLANVIAQKKANLAPPPTIIPNTPPPTTEQPYQPPVEQPYQPPIEQPYQSPQPRVENNYEIQPDDDLDTIRAKLERGQQNNDPYLGLNPDNDHEFTDY